MPTSLSRQQYVAVWSSNLMATQFGKRCSVPLTTCSRLRAYRTPISHSLSPSHTSAVRPSMSRVLQKNVPLLPTIVSRTTPTALVSWSIPRQNSKKNSLFVQPPKPSSGQPTRTGSPLTAICLSSATSGATSCAGRCVHACSSVPPSSSGRKATPPMPPVRRPSSVPCR